MILDAHSLIAPSAVLDPSSGLELRGELNNMQRAWRLQFPALDLPGPGKLKIGSTRTLTEIAVAIVEPSGELRPLRAGELQLETLDPARAQGTIEYANAGDDARHLLRFDLIPQLRPLIAPKVTGARVPSPFPAAVDTPNSEDLVFCALGNQGTGLPGQKQVAEAIANLAPTGPLDFVILLGDNFAPRGVASTRDPQWRSKFEDVYPPARLAVPFRAVLGDTDWQGSDRAQDDYTSTSTSTRWVCKKLFGNYELQSHGKTIAFFPADTTLLTGKIEDSRTRIAQRSVLHTLEPSKADWKIIYGHSPIHSAGECRGLDRQRRLADMLGQHLGKMRADVYLCADERVLQLFTPKDGVTHIVSGGGGGPEMAGCTTWTEDTRFAATGGGFTWFRFDGTKLEISFRDVHGKVLFVHHLTKG